MCNQRSARSSALAMAGAVALASSPPALAHVIAGARVFPVTLTFDDPGVSDEVSLPSFGYSRSGADDGAGPTHEVDLGFEYDKTITPDTALILNTGYDVFDTEGAKTEAGWENTILTGKWQAYTNAPHELVVSLGVQRVFGGSGTNHVGADRFGSTSPTAYLGKGFGDLPVPMLRPLAVTGELGYSIADKELKQVDTPSGFNNGDPNAWSAGISLQYSLPYLQSQVRDLGLGRFLGNLVPLVEFTWSAPASRPSSQGTSWVAAPGAIYMAQWGEVGVEALIPLDRNAGSNVGVVGLVHFFLDDLFPHSIGKPLFQ